MHEINSMPFENKTSQRHRSLHGTDESPEHETSEVRHAIAIDGIVLTLADIKGSKEHGRIKVNSDALVGEILDPVPGGSIIESMPQAHEGAMRLKIEVKRNEVLLKIRENNGIVADIAIGLDDIQDGLEGVTNRM